MPRDVLGRYTLPTGNPVVSGTIISDTWANTTLSDIALALTNSLPKDGTVALSAPLKFTDGNAAAPSIAFANDATTGVYKPTNGILGFSTGGAERVRIDTTGNVGVGLTNPSFPLHIYRNAAGTYGSAYIESGASAQYAPRLTLADNRTGQSGRNWSIASGGAANGALVIQDDSAGTYRVVIDTAGKLGIGTNAPGYQLDVGANSGNQVVRVNGGNTNAGDGASVYFRTGTTTHGIGNLSSIYGGTYNSDLTIYSGSGNTLFYNGGSERVRIDNAGNVGIGTNNPSGWNAALAVVKPSGNNSVSVINSGATGSDLSNVTAYANGYSTTVSQYGNGGSFLYSSGSYFNVGTTSNAYTAFVTNNTERARITADGKLGLGTTAPTARIHATATGFFVPSSSAISLAASLVEGSYGGGYLMKDGANYLGTYSISGQYNIGLGTSSGLLTAFTVASVNQSIINSGGSGYGQLTINGANGNDRGVQYQTNGSSRWQIGATNEGESTGFNVGSNLAIHRYNDSGAWLGAPLRIQRDTGLIYTTVENSSSSFRAYSARVFANFNGAGSVAANQTIRASGGVTSIYKNATGDYTINFADAQYDANYTFIGTAAGQSAGGAAVNSYIVNEHWQSSAPTNKSTTALRIVCSDNNSDTAIDAMSIAFAIYR